jgi:hypothetical protein
VIGSVIFIFAVVAMVGNVLVQMRRERSSVGA